jgi:16S rRNA (guanine(1405)-N(7))-methyltransferase
MKLSSEQREALLARILGTRKYRGSGLNPETVLDLIDQLTPKQTSEKALYKDVRRRLHNIVAPYLGEPDYASLTERLDALEDTSPDSPELRAFCRDVLAEHASTAERIPHLDDFYEQLFAATGVPASILDLACGLHPLGLPWMNLPQTTQYHAYDILQPRIDFLNRFLLALGMAPLAENRDILINPPELEANLGLFFKEAHRFEKRQPGCNRDFWASLKVDTLAVSLPTENLAGTHSLLDQHRRLVEENLSGTGIREEIQIENEVIFLIDHPGRP